MKGRAVFMPAAYSLLLAYAVAAVWLLARSAVPNLDLKLLVIQYLFVLPAAVLILRADRAASPPAFRAGGPAVICLVAVSTGLAILTAYSIKTRSLTGDESAYRFQARILASGHLGAEAPPLFGADTAAYRNAYHFNHHIIHGNKWFGKYPLGWPVLLSAGTAAGADWLVNPMLALVLLFLTYRIGRIVFDETVARLGVAILALSAFFLDQGSSFLSHVSCGVFIAAAFWLLLVWRSQASKSALALMLVCVACAFSIRPFTTACVTPVFAFGALAPLKNGRGKLLWIVVWAALTAVLFAGILLGMNRIMTGGYRLSPYALYRGTELPPEINLNPLTILANIPFLTRWSMQTTFLYGFLFVLPLACFWVWRERGAKVEARMLAALFLMLLFGYMVQTEPSYSFFGERYYFEGYFAVALLGGAGWMRLLRDWRPAPRQVTLCAALLFGMAMLHIGLFYRQYLNRWTDALAISRLIERLPLAEGVVFLPSPQSHEVNYNDADWRRAKRFYVPDPGEALRAGMVRALGKDAWAVVRYDAGTRQASAEVFQASGGTELPPVKQ